MSRLLALMTTLSLTLAGCVPIPIVVPLDGAPPRMMGMPVKALPGDPPKSATVDAALATARANAGSPPLASNAGLDRVAAQYAAELAQGDKLMLGLPTGAKARQRIVAAGLSQCSAGEVISQGFPTEQAAVTAWLSDPRQRKTLVKRSFANYGFGHAPDQSGRGSDVWVIVLLDAC